MSTQQSRSGGGGGAGGRQKKSNAVSGGSGGGNADVATHSATVSKKTEANKTEKPEKVQPKATTEQLRIAQITNNTTEDPQINEKVSLLLTMTQRSEEEVCCALNECDYDLEAAANFLIEILPQGAFAKYEKKRKNKAAALDGAGGDGESGEGNSNPDKREKMRSRNVNRGGRGGTDSRGWRGREARENERNTRESRGGDRGGDGGANENYRGQRNSSRNGPGGGRGGFVARPGRGGGRMGGRSGGGRGDRGYGARNNANDDHHEVELWDNTIAQNAEKQQQTHDDTWGDWNNEEYEGSLKDSKVFTTSNLTTQTTASVVSAGTSTEVSAPPGLEHNLGTSVLGASPLQGSHLNSLGTNADNSGVPPVNLTGSTTTPLLQYSAAVSNPPPQLQSVGTQSSGSTLSSSPFGTTDTFSSAASAAAALVQQQAPKASATLSAEQSQYFNSLSSQSTTTGVPQQSAVSGYAQSTGYGQNTSAIQYPSSYANVFSSAPGASVAPVGDQSQLVVGGHQQPQIRRARVKLPPPSKIPSSAVEMPGDNALNNVGYIDVQFGAMDFGTDDTFDALSEKFNTGVTIDGQQTQDDYQGKTVQQQSSLTAGLQNSQILQGDSLSAAGYTTRSAVQQQSNSTVNASSNALDQLSKNDPYGPTSAGGSSAAAYQSAYQTSAASKVNSAYQPSTQGYNSSSYGNVQSAVANSYQSQGYGSYQPNVVSSYQQQQTGTSAPNASGNVTGSATSAQNIPVGGSSSSQNNTSANASSSYLTSGYSTPQSTYQSSQSVYGSAGLSNNSGFAGSSSNPASQYSNFSASTKLKDTSSAAGAAHFDSVSSSSGVSNSSVGNTGNGAASSTAGATGAITAGVSNVNNNNVSASNSASSGATSNNSNAAGNQNSSSIANVGSAVGGVSGGAIGGVNNNSSTVSSGAQSASGTSSVIASLTNKNSSSSNSSGSGVTSGSAGNGTGPGAGAGSGGGSGSGSVPSNIQMVSQYIQTGLPYYQQPLYSYDDLQVMQQRLPHVQTYYDLNYTPTSLGAGRDNLGSVAYSAMTDGRFGRTDNNSSPVSNQVSSTMSQQPGSNAPMLNVPYAYFYGGNVMPGSFQYGTPAIYPQQIPTASNASGGQFPKPSYSAGYGSTSYDTLSQNTQDYTKGGYSSGVNQQNKTQTVSNQPQSGTGSDLTSSMYGSKGHVTLNKSYEKQNFHSGTPPPFNMANTQSAGGTSSQPYGMYLPMPAAGHHMIHQPMHQMDGRIHSSSRRDSNSAGQRQQSSSQSKSASKQGYSPSYWTGQN